MSDFKYLFAYSIPLMTLVSISSDGIMTFATPIYAFIFIPLLEVILKDYDTEYSDAQKNKRLNNIVFDVLLYLNIFFVFALLVYGLFIMETKSLMTYEIIGIWWESCSVSSHPHSKDA